MIKYVKKYIPNTIKLKIKQVYFYIKTNFNTREQKNKKKYFIMRRKVNKNLIRIAFLCGGGLGDFIIYLPIVDKIIASCKCKIDLFANCKFGYPQIIFGERLNINLHVNEYEKFYQHNYDLCFESTHFTIVKYDTNCQFIKKEAPKLLNLALIIDNFNELCGSHRVEEPWRYIAAIKRAQYSNLNRWSFLSPNDIFEMNEQRSGVFIDESNYNYFQNKLNGAVYIVISCGASPLSGGVNQTKVWKKERCEEFIKNFKNKYSHIIVLQVATKNEPPLVGADKILCDIELKKLMIILKHAKAYVGSEGGMAHLATQMSTPSIVAFGPTPVHYYGYKRNINIVSPYCSSCMGAIREWYTKCPRGHEHAKCMDAITGDMVLSAVDAILMNTIDSCFIRYNEKININDLICNETVVGFFDITLFDIAINIKNKNATVFMFSKNYLNINYESTIQEKDIMSHNLNMKSLNDIGISTIISNIFNIPKNDEYFHAIVVNSKLLQSDHRQYALDEIKRILKFDGYLFLSDGKVITEVMIKKEK